MVFHVPAPFSFKNTKEVPWSYLPTVSVGGKPIANVEPTIDNIAGIGGITRSGRVFSPDQPNKSIENAPV
ncbi:gag-protease polyprotein, partial [Trifolium medium]|nr:gag-protease polyprotein [Trifolium medium]